MLPPALRQHLRRIVLVGLIGALPLLYLGGVTLESTGFSTAALAVTGVVAILAILSY